MSAAEKSGARGTMLEEDTDQNYENVLAEIQSFELPIEATLRYGIFIFCCFFSDHKITFS
jgi:hypothetical protein